MSQFEIGGMSKPRWKWKQEGFFVSGYGLGESMRGLCSLPTREQQEDLDGLGGKP